MRRGAWRWWPLLVFALVLANVPTSALAAACALARGEGPACAMPCCEGVGTAGAPSCCDCTMRPAPDRPAEGEHPWLGSPQPQDLEMALPVVLSVVTMVDREDEPRVAPEPTHRARAPDRGAHHLRAPPAR